MYEDLLTVLIYSYLFKNLLERVHRFLPTIRHSETLEGA